MKRNKNNILSNILLLTSVMLVMGLQVPVLAYQNTQTQNKQTVQIQDLQKEQDCKPCQAQHSKQNTNPQQNQTQQHQTKQQNQTKQNINQQNQLSVPTLNMAIRFLEKNKIIAIIKDNQRLDEKYRANDLLTKVEFAALLYNLEKEFNSDFTYEWSPNDITNEDWFYDIAKKIDRKGYLKLDKNGNYNPYTNITIGEFIIQIMNHYVKLDENKQTIQQQIEYLADLVQPIDNNKIKNINQWNKPYVRLFNNYINLEKLEMTDLAKNITRGEAFRIIATLEPNKDSLYNKQQNQQPDSKQPDKQQPDSQGESNESR